MTELVGLQRTHSWALRNYTVRLVDCIKTHHSIDNFQYGVSELEEILNFVQQRMMTEEYYANRLQELSSVRVKAAKKGEESPLEKDETNSVLHQVLSTMRQEATIISSTHRHMHDTLNRTYTSLKRFLDDHRKLLQSRKDAIDVASKKYEVAVGDFTSKRKEAASKWVLAKEADSKYKEQLVSSKDLNPLGPGKDILVNFGDQEFTVIEFNDLVSNMERDIPKIDVKSIIGTYKSVVAGSTVLKYLMTTGSKHRSSLQSIESATAFLTALINQNFLKSIALRNSNKLSVVDQQYQWKKTCLSNEPLHTKSRREAERAEMEYRNAAKAAEECRVNLETSCVEHMKAIQVSLLERLTLARTVISSYIDSELSCISPITQSCDRFNVLLEMFSPERQVQAMAERDRTGNARFRPIVYMPSTKLITVESRFVKSVVFGVGLETLSRREGRKVPSVLRYGLKSLVRRAEAQGGQSHELALWVEASMYAPSVQALRLEINGSGKQLSLVLLQAQTPATIIGLLKLWLLQLPNSVCSNEIYEPLKLLYLSKSDEFAAMRSGSITSLLTTLSPTHYNCLYALVSYWQQLLADTDTVRDDTRVAELSQVMGHLVLKPKIESQVTAHDKHPHRFLRDLLTHDKSEIFGPGMTPSSSTQSLQLEGEDLDADLELDETPQNDGSNILGDERIILLESPTAKAGVLVSPVDQDTTSVVQHTTKEVVANATVSLPRESLSSAAAKSEEDLFLEAEAEGLDLDLNEEDLKDLELEVDQILKENPDLL